MLYQGLLFSIFLEYVRPGSYLPVINAIKINSLVPIIVLIATIFYKGSITNGEVFKHSNSRWILFFLFLLVVSILHADVTLYSYNRFKGVLGFVFLYYIIVRLITNREKIKGLFFVFVCSHIMLLIINPQVILDPATRSYIYENTYLGDGNDFSLSVCITIPMCIYLFIETNKMSLKILYALGMVILLLAIIGTQSRGATIALASVFFYLWLVGRQKMAGLMLIGALLAVVVNYAPPAYFERLDTIKNYQTEGSAQGRIVAWKTAIRMVKKYPLTGVGSGHFAVKLGTEFRPPEFGTNNLPWLTAHSIYFLVIGELGLPGIFCLMILLISNYYKNTSYAKSAVKRTREDSINYRLLFVMLNSSLIAFAVGGAFLSVAYYPHLYILLGIMTAAHDMYEKDKVSETGVSKFNKKDIWYENDPARAVWTDDKNDRL